MEEMDIVSSEETNSEQLQLGLLDTHSRPQTDNLSLISEYFLRKNTMNLGLRKGLKTGKG